MTDANRKPWLTASEQIDHLKSRGVHFSLMSEDDARAYLEKSSNSFRFACLSAWVSQVEEGNRKGEVCKSRFKEAVAALCVVRSLITIQKLFGSFKGDAFK